MSLSAERAAQDEDDGLLALDEEVPHIALQPTAEAADDAAPLLSHPDGPVIAAHHHLNRDGG